MKRILILCVFCGLVFSSTRLYANPIKNLFEQATKEYTLGHYDNAIVLYEKILEFVPNFAPAYNYLALAHKDKGADAQEVIWLFKRAIEIDPNYAIAYENLGKVYYSLGDFKLAEEASLQAFKIDPQSVTAQLSLAWTYLLGLSSPGKAIEYFKKNTETQNVPSSIYGLGMAYFMDHQKTKVLSVITRLRNMGEDHLAMQLEAMIRGGKYKKSDGIERALLSPILPKSQPRKSVSMESIAKRDAELYQNPPSAPVSMPVRLSEKFKKRNIAKSPVQRYRKGSSRSEPMTIEDMQNKARDFKIQY